MVFRCNAATRIPTSPGAGDMEPPPLETLYDVALAADRAREPAAGYRLYWMSGDRFGSCDVPAEPESFVVVGRHALCDGVLDVDPEVALRHLLVRATRLDDGAARISIIDLHTSLGFRLADGRHARSVVATGPLGLTVGGYAIVALPGGEPSPAELPPPRVAEGNPYREPAPGRITLMPRPSLIGETSSAVHASVAITVTGARGTAVVSVSPLDLELGVLVGRAPKCNDVLRTVLHDGISRVHLLLRGNVAYDIASTQGTFAGGRRVRSVRFGAGPIQIGTASPIFVRVAPTL